MVRTILHWRILGEDLVGTCHVPTPGKPGGLAFEPAIGVLLLNPGPAMRSGNSDLSARIGDRLALRGFPVFRFDLAGLGDSSGSTPADLDAYWSEVVDGRNDAATVALIARIQLEFGVGRVVVGGLCAAALPALRALGAPGASPAGLILLEPNLRLETVPSAQGKRGPEVNTVGHRLLGRAERPIRKLFQRVGRVVERVGGARPPRDVNVALLQRWQTSLARGVRALVVVAAGDPTDHYVARILAAMPARARAAVVCVRVPGTNHLFTAGTGRDAVLSALERWMIGSAA